jgi:hypothetical protein
VHTLDMPLDLCFAAASAVDYEQAGQCDQQRGAQPEKPVPSHGVCEHGAMTGSFRKTAQMACN